MSALLCAPAEQDLFRRCAYALFFFFRKRWILER